MENSTRYTIARNSKGFYVGYREGRYIRQVSTTYSDRAEAEGFMNSLNLLLESEEGVSTVVAVNNELVNMTPSVTYPAVMDTKERGGLKLVKKTRRPGVYKCYSDNDFILLVMSLVEKSKVWIGTGEELISAVQEQAVSSGGSVNIPLDGRVFGKWLSGMDDRGAFGEVGLGFQKKKYTDTLNNRFTLYFFCLEGMDTPNNIKKAIRQWQDRRDKEPEPAPQVTNTLVCKAPKEKVVSLTPKYTSTLDLADNPVVKTVTSDKVTFSFDKKALEVFLSMWQKGKLPDFDGNLQVDVSIAQK